MNPAEENFKIELGGEQEIQGRKGGGEGGENVGGVNNSCPPGYKTSTL